MNLKKMKMLLVAAVLAGTLFTGCGNSSSETAETNNTAENQTSEAEGETGTTDSQEAEEEKEETDSEEEADSAEEVAEEEEDTGDATLDNARNQDEIGEKELLVISFGTSYNDSRRLTIGAIEDALEEAFPDYSVRRGFTSNIIIDHINKRDGVLIDDVNAALNRAVDNGVKTLVIQPTHLMNGLEYEELEQAVAEFSDAFEHVAIAKPLLSSTEDFKMVEDALVDWTSEYDDGKTAICFMGHGTEAESNEVYKKIQEMLTGDGYENYFVGTVEATPSLDDILEQVKQGDYSRVVLEPLMVVAGDHANNDMAGDEEGSWKKTFEDAGYEVTCLLRGLGENKAIQQIYVEHAQAAMSEINE